MQFSNLSTANSEARGEADRLKKEVAKLKKEIQDLKAEHQKNLSQEKAKWEEQKQKEVADEVDKAKLSTVAEMQAKFDGQEAQVLQAFTQVIESFEQERKQYFNITEEGVTSLVSAMCKRIVGEWIDHHPEAVENSVKQALSYLGNEKELILLLNPVDIDWVQDRFKDWLPLSSIDIKVRLRAEERIARGGCLMETDAGSVDVRVGQMLDDLEAFVKNQMNMAEKAGEE